MAEKRRREEWDRHVWLYTAIANTFAGKKGEPYQMADFHPLMDERERRESIPTVSLRELGMLMGGKRKKKDRPRPKPETSQ